jgi:hypothetical protein
MGLSVTKITSNKRILKVLHKCFMHPGGGELYKERMGFYYALIASMLRYDWRSLAA